MFFSDFSFISLLSIALPSPFKYVKVKQPNQVRDSAALFVLKWEVGVRVASATRTRGAEPSGDGSPIACFLLSGKSKKARATSRTRTVRRLMRERRGCFAPVFSSGKKRRALAHRASCHIKALCFP